MGGTTQLLLWLQSWLRASTTSKPCSWNQLLKHTQHLFHTVAIQLIMCRPQQWLSCWKMWSASSHSC